ncbi:MAG TPA: response regulator, partial [Bryobacterales bacterium]|nr:response regulator [Bryobacterales bacterium]
SELTTLVVMPQERRSHLIRHLDEIPVAVLTASSCAEAAELLRNSPAVRVVLTDLCLPDGSWFDILNSVSDLKSSTPVVVCARLADERLWSQVLEAGGFDVLVEPYEAPEVRRIVRAATAGHPSRALATAC